MNTPNFATMTDEEKLRWMDEHSVELMRAGTVHDAGSGPLGEFADDDLKITTVRFPESVLTEIDHRTSNRRGARTEFIRQAVEEKLAALRAQEAA